MWNKKFSRTRVWSETLPTQTHCRSGKRLVPSVALTSVGDRFLVSLSLPLSISLSTATYALAACGKTSAAHHTMSTPKNLVRPSEKKGTTRARALALARRLACASRHAFSAVPVRRSRLAVHRSSRGREQEPRSRCVVVVLSSAWAAWLTCAVPSPRRVADVHAHERRIRRFSERRRGAPHAPPSPLHPQHVSSSFSSSFTRRARRPPRAGRVC